MNLKTNYNFKEASLGPDFAQDKLRDFKKMIEASQSFTLTSMPGVGASYFLKYLTTTNLAFFIHIDLYLLPTLTQHEFYRLLHREVGGKVGPKTDEQVFLETKNILKNYAQKYDKVVVIFSRFDQLKKVLDANFLSNLQSLTTIAPGKIVLIFTAIKPLHELNPEAISGGNLNFYSKHLYFKPYSKQDLKKLLTIEPEQLAPDADLERLIELSGGHNQLLHILLNSQKQQNLMLDKFVKLQLKELLDYLDYQQRKQVQKIALGKKVTSPVTKYGVNFASHPVLAAKGEPRFQRDTGSIIDEYLLGVGMVTRSVILSDPAPDGAGESKDLSKFELFTPLLKDYIKQNMPVKLPPKEAKLFKLLRKNMGNIVSKDEIFAEVWGAEVESATDWALDALIYRLRKHPFITSQGYIIESHKKVGYSLVQV